MNKIFITLLSLSIGSLTFGQVHINVEGGNEEPSAILQVDAENHGFGAPEVSLISIELETPIAVSPEEGLLVYNPNLTKEIEPGYYYWLNTPTPHWERLGGINEKGTIIQNINEEFLGYAPTGSGLDAPSTGVMTKERCARWEINEGGNGHVYCAYTSTNSLNFNTLFTVAKGLGGYVVTIVSDAEWNFVKDNIINVGPGLGGSVLSNNIWLGYTKISTPGNPTPKYQFITGESWENRWSNNATTQSQFATGEPQAATVNTTTRCTYISSSASDPQRLWRSQPCSTTSNMNHFIIEFNQ